MLDAWILDKHKEGYTSRIATSKRYALFLSLPLPSWFITVVVNGDGDGDGVVGDVVVVGDGVVALLGSYALPSRFVTLVVNGGGDGVFSVQILHSKNNFDIEITYFAKKIETWWSEYVVSNMYWRSNLQSNSKNANNNCTIGNYFLRWGHVTPVTHGLCITTIQLWSVYGSYYCLIKWPTWSFAYYQLTKYW